MQEIYERTCKSCHFEKYGSCVLNGTSQADEYNHCKGWAPMREWPEQVIISKVRTSNGPGFSHFNYEVESADGQTLAVVCVRHPSIYGPGKIKVKIYELFGSPRRAVEASTDEMLSYDDLTDRLEYPGPAFTGEPGIAWPANGGWSEGKGIKYPITIIGPALLERGL